MTDKEKKRLHDIQNIPVDEVMKKNLEMTERMLYNLNKKQLTNQQ